jgi:hypothetical protein
LVSLIEIIKANKLVVMIHIKLHINNNFNINQKINNKNVDYALKYPINSNAFNIMGKTSNMGIKIANF